MRRITIICSFVLICIFMTGSYLLHKIHLGKYKKEFQAHMLKQSDLYITINPGELYSNTSLISWEDNNHELIYKGKLYDVLNLETRGTKVFIMVISDEKEELLKHEFAGLYNDRVGHEKKDPFSLLKNFFALKFIFTANKLGFPGPTIHNLVFHRLALFRLMSRHFSQQVPPP